MTLSRSQMTTGRAQVRYSASHRLPAMALCSPAGEYFLKMTLPPASVKISMGSPSRIFRVRRISLGMTTRPRSSLYVK